MLQAQLKSFMYVDRSLRGDPEKDKLIGDLNFTNCMHLNRIQKSKLFVGITVKKRKFIIHPEFIVANHIIADQFIKNLKSNPHKLYAFKENTKKQVLCWYFSQTKKVYHSS